jgi:ABC-type phosphate transport system substrate-binding protein
MKRIVMALLAVFAVLGTEKAGAQQFVVVVNPACNVDQISAADLSKIFEKKMAKLPDGEAAKPVDQAKNANVREAFSQAVHGRSAAQIESYWQQQIFSGKDVPPEEKKSDADVIAYVKSTPGAIGYVSAGTAVSGVKVVKIVG